MIILIEPTPGRLMIYKDGSYLNGPFTSKSFGEKVLIEQLKASPGIIEAHFSEFQKGTGSTFEEPAELMTYLAPFMGFNPASGGSEAPTIYTDTILVSSAQILTMGSGPVDLAAQFSGTKTAGQFYNIQEVISIFTPGTVAYSGTDRFTLGGAFSVVSDPFTLNKHAPGSPVVMIARTSAPAIFNDGGYVNAYVSFLANRGLELSTWSGDDVTLGDGTLEFRITYTIENL